MMDEREHRRRAIAHLKRALRYERSGFPAKARAHFGRSMHYGFGADPSDLPNELIEMIIMDVIDGSSTEVRGGMLSAAFHSLRLVKVDVPAFLAMQAEDRRKHMFYPFYICTMHATARKSTYGLLWRYEGLATKRSYEISERKGIVEALMELRIMIVEYWYHMCPYRFHDLVEILHAEGTPDEIKVICRSLLGAFMSHLNSREECTECRILRREEIKLEIGRIINKEVKTAAIDVNDDGRVAEGFVKEYESDLANKKAKYGHLCVWKTGTARDMSLIFNNIVWNDEAWDVRLWDTRIVTTMFRAFQYCDGLLRGVEQWSVGKVTNMSNMFSGASGFDRDISRWDTRQVKNMSRMFNLTSFNQDISKWNTRQVTDMSYMFSSTSVFNRDIGNWDTSKVTSMNYMFFYAGSFNQPIGKWNTSNVRDMSGIFMKAASFNQPIGKWNTSNVRDMKGMFFDATSFNHDIGGWDTSQVNDMTDMFCGASAFNKDISRWKLSKVHTAYLVDRMFDGAKAMEHKNKPVVIQT
jgi:surface protein